MTITLTGANSFLLQEALDQLVGTFVAQQGDLALERIDGEEAEFPKIAEALTSLPFFTDKKMVVLRAPSKNKLFVEKIEQLFLQIPETTDVIIVEPKLDKRAVYYKFLKRVTDYREFNELDQNGLVQWLVAKATEKDGVLRPAEARYLIERIGAYQQRLASELEKLLLYNREISRKTIDLLTEATPQSTIFHLLEAAFAGNSTRVLQLYREQRTLKVEPPQIIALLVWQLHILAIVKAAGTRSSEQIAKEAKLNPYVVNKSLAIARKLPIATLRRLLSDLLTIDSRSKREAIDSDEALQLYLLTIAR